MATAIRGIIVSLVVALGSLPAAAGRGATASASDPATHTVTIDGTRFDPEVLTVNAGDVVIWVNEDPFPHTATSETGRFDSKTIPPGKSWKHQTVKRGEFAYICAFHPTMKGTLRVR